MYEQVMAELKDRDVTTKDYEMLLSLENKQSKLTFEQFCLLAFQKQYKNPDDYQYVTAHCSSCNMEIADKAQGLQLHNCSHKLHKVCLEDVFKENNDN